MLIVTNTGLREWMSRDCVSKDGSIYTGLVHALTCICWQNVEYLDELSKLLFTIILYTLLISPFIVQVLLKCTFQVPGTILGVEVTNMNRIWPFPMKSLVGKINRKHANTINWWKDPNFMIAQRRKWLSQLVCLRHTWNWYQMSFIGIIL